MNCLMIMYQTCIQLLVIIFISKNPEKYGFNVISETPFQWIVKEIKKSVKVDHISKCSGINLISIHSNSFIYYKLIFYL